MPLMLYNGGLLTVDGALATSVDCCCEVVCVCDCAILQAAWGDQSVLNYEIDDGPCGIAVSGTMLRTTVSGCPAWEANSVSYGEVGSFSMQLVCNGGSITVTAIDFGDGNCIITDFTVTSITCTETEFIVEFTANVIDAGMSACVCVGNSIAGRIYL